jgi:hypothetical protein
MFSNINVPSRKKIHQQGVLETSEELKTDIKLLDAEV